MTARFDYFAIIAGMRTGSNLLEELLDAHPALYCHGELFNPHFVGTPDRQAGLGVSRDDRDADPDRLIGAVRASAGLAGLRIFDGHDPRALDAILSDPRCGKIVLTRNPLDSFVSLKIARQTKQWWLGDLASAKTGKVRFDPVEFGEFLSSVGDFRRYVRHSVQVSGQSVFAIDYDDLSDDDVIAGLYRFLGCDPITRPAQARSKVQNPDGVRDKVTNPKAMEAALAQLDPFGLEGIPDFEPARGPGARGFRVAADAAVMVMPIGGIATDQTDTWLTGLSGGTPPRTGLSQKELRVWMRTHPGHRRITVVEHPVARIHDSFVRNILPPAAEGFGELRDLLARRFDVPLPDDPTDPGFDRAAHKSAFLAFLRFVRGNLGGQTGVKVSPAWASQSVLLAGVSQFALPDMVIRREELGVSLSRIAEDLDLSAVAPPDGTVPAGVALADIYDDTIESVVRQAYRRDYIALGYGDWR